MNSELVTAREKLLRTYRKWEAELRSNCRELITQEFSYPYYLHIPDHWFDSEIRIMIVGKEGAGKKEFNRPIEEAQEFNKKYLISQLCGGDENYRLNHSPFWRRIRKIAKLPGVGICWNNLDKIHRIRNQKCALLTQQRKTLHQTPIKILREEIDLLQPTHVVFFGWYWDSLEQECPDVYRELRHRWENDSSGCKEKKIVSFRLNDIGFLFTYHPAWSNRQGEEGKLYESDVIKELQMMLSRTH